MVLGDWDWDWDILPEDDNFSIQGDAGSSSIYGGFIPQEKEEKKKKKVTKKK